MIRKAVEAELDEIMRFVREAKITMHSSGNPQWGDHYPLREDFEDDLRAGTLFAYELDGHLAGIACVNTNQSPEYADLDWNGGHDATVVHRMVVDHAAQGHGIGGAFLEFAADTARNNGTYCIRTDTHSLNLPMNAALKRHGFEYRGQVHFFKVPGPFNCYERVVSR